MKDDLIDTNDNDELFSLNVAKVGKADFFNYPLIVEKFSDPHTQNDMVLIVVCLPSGSQNVDIDLNEDGTKAIIKYNWTLTLYDMADLFKSDLIKKKLAMYHPKILACSNGLKRVRPKIDVPPESKIFIKLPIKVETALKFRSRQGIKRDDGTMILMAEFKGLMNQYIKTSSHTFVSFEN